MINKFLNTKLPFATGVMIIWFGILCSYYLGFYLYCRLYLKKQVTLKQVLVVGSRTLKLIFAGKDN